MKSVSSPRGPQQGTKRNAPRPAPRKLGRPPQVKAHDTRRRILDIARGVYAEQGFEAATNKKIADLAHMTTAALYYHFPSKRDLYQAVHADALAQVHGRFIEVIDRRSNFASQLTSVLTASHELNASDPTLARFLSSANVDMKRKPELTDILNQTIANRQRFFDRMVEVGVRTGEILPHNREIVSVFIIAMVTGMTDALSDDQTVHAHAIEAVKCIISGNLIRPPTCDAGN